MLRGVLGQEQVTNAVAGSLRSSGGTLNNRRSPTAALGALIAGNGNAASAAAALQGAQGSAVNAGGFGSGGGFGQNSQVAQTPQGFTTPDLTVQPAPDINAIVVRGTPTAVAGIETIVADLDVRRPAGVDRSRHRRGDGRSGGGAGDPVSARPARH